jgi:hypothetical protein
MHRMTICKYANILICNMRKTHRINYEIMQSIKKTTIQANPHLLIETTNTSKPPKQTQDTRKTKTSWEAHSWMKERSTNPKVSSKQRRRGTTIYGKRNNQVEQPSGANFQAELHVKTSTGSSAWPDPSSPRKLRGNVEPTWTCGAKCGHRCTSLKLQKLSRQVCTFALIVHMHCLLHPLNYSQERCIFA